MICVKPIAESLDYILTHQCSVARFGDGEMDLVAGHGIPYQDYDEALARQLRLIMGLESSEQFLVCLSDVFEGRERYNHNFSYFWDLHLERFSALYEEVCQAPWYGSTFISRPYIDLADKSLSAGYFDKLKQLWSGRDVLIVEGEMSRSGVGNDLFAQAKSISRVICPSKNAYAVVDEIAQAIRQHGKDKLVLLMLGPTAKVLSYELSQEGFWTIDLGHVDSEYEWFLMGATHKVQLDHKHTAEHNYDEGVVLVADELYEAQIVATVGLSPLISVIVPVYNVSAYLDECVRSLRQQSYPALEILLVDDGSTDDSGDKCDRYAAEDPRVRVIHKANGGLSDARNRGLAEARGAYVTFVDSDDAINEDFVKDCYQQVVDLGADLVVSTFFQYSEPDNCFYFYADKSTWGQAEVVSRQEALNRQVKWGTLNTAPFVVSWAKLYKRELFEGVRFPVGRVWEDEATTHKLFLRAERIVFLNKDYYMYRRRADSIMGSQYSLKKTADYIKALEERIVDLALAREDFSLTVNKLWDVLVITERDMQANGLTEEPLYAYVQQQLALKRLS